MRVARLAAWGRLLRLSLAPSAAADAAAGTVLAAGAWPGGPRPLLLVLASLCVYHAGLALNDWADRELDARVRPTRPIPSGAVGAEAALFVALLLFALGPFLASLAGTRSALILALVAALALAYDLGPRGPWLGPLLLGLCRAGNLGAGIALGLSLRPPALPLPESWLALPPVFYGLYVFTLSRLARLEDQEDADFAAERPRIRRRLALAALWLALFALFPLLVRYQFASILLDPTVELDSSEREAVAIESNLSGLFRFAFAALVLVSASGLVRLAVTTQHWTREKVLGVVGMGLRRLLVATSVTAASAATTDGFAVALCILAGYPLSHALRRVFPPS